MFSHEVIKSLRVYYRGLPKVSESHEIVKELATKVWQADKFHFGNASDVTEIAGINGRKKTAPKAFSDPEDYDLIIEEANVYYRMGNDQMFKEKLDNFKDMGMPDAYCGDPASASVEEGDTTLQILARILVHAIEEWFDGREPDHSRGLFGSRPECDKAESE